MNADHEEVPGTIAWTSKNQRIAIVTSADGEELGRLRKSPTSGQLQQQDLARTRGRFTFFGAPPAWAALPTWVRRQLPKFLRIDGAP